MSERGEGEGLIDSPLRGIFLIIGAMLVFSVQDVIIRLLSSGYSAFEIVFIRGLVAIIPITVFVFLSGGLKTLRMRHPVLNFIRGSLMFLSYLTYYAALAAMPIAEVTAIFFVSPLITTVFSVIFIKEFVGPRRWIAVLIGFAGVLVIVQPGSDSMHPTAFLPMLASLTYSSSVMITRRLGATQNGASMAFYSMLVFIILSAVIGGLFGDGAFTDESNASLGFLLREWIVPNFDDFLLLIVCGVVAACGFYCLSQAYRIAPVSTIAPFEYTAMPCAVIWGVIFWNEIPPATTFLGITMIIGSGLYVLHRETAHKKRLQIA